MPAFATPPVAMNISMAVTASCNSSSATSGERSSPRQPGTKRRSGRTTGSVMRSTNCDSGLWKSARPQCRRNLRMYAIR